MGMAVGSLFSGIGGLEFGLEMAGAGPIRWQCEKDPVAREVLAARWPGTTVYDDVEALDGRSVEPVDIICGGFPCQDLSVAGKGAGLGADRSGLWWQFRRVVRQARPRYVFIENVYRGWRRWLPVVRRSLWRVGYASLPLRVRAADVGAPHDRARLFVLAYAHGERLEERLGDRRGQVQEQEEHAPAARGGAVAHPYGGGCEVLGGAQPGRLQGPRGSEPDRCSGPWREHRFPPGPAGIAGWAGPQPAVRRGSDGLPAGMVPSRAQQLRLLGNSVVPQAAAAAFMTLLGRLGEGVSS